MDLTQDEQERIEADIKRVKPEDEARVREKFSGKFAEASAKGAGKGFKVIRDLMLSVRCLYEMLVDPDYAITWETKARIVFALGYFISPIDLIPDAVPVVGYMDDAVVVMFIVHNLTGEIAKYRQFRRECGRPLPDV